MFIEHPTADFLACELPCWIRTLHCPLSKSIPSAHRGKRRSVSQCSQNIRHLFACGSLLVSESNFTIIFIWIASYQYFWVSRNAVGPIVPWYMCVALIVASGNIRNHSRTPSTIRSNLPIDNNQEQFPNWQQLAIEFDSNVMESACVWQTIEARTVGSRLRALVIRSESIRDPFFPPLSLSPIADPPTVESQICETRAISAFW